MTLYGLNNAWALPATVPSAVIDTELPKDSEAGVPDEPVGRIMAAGKLSVTAPVGELAVISLGVPVMLVTSLLLVVASV